MSATVFTRPEFLADPRNRFLDDDAPRVIAAACRAAGRRAVWVEGFQEAGKSQLADRVAAELGWRVVHLDKQMRENCGDRDSYIAYLDPAKLQAALGTEDRRIRVVIEGICLRDALGSLADRQSAFVVYLMRITESVGRLIWHDGINLESATPLEPIARAENLYHRSKRPHGDADLTLARIE